MSQLYFFNGEGDPLVGKPPLELRFVGQVLPDAAVQAVRLANQWLHDVRIGMLRQLRRQAVLTDGTLVQFRHVFGVSTVTITAPANTSRKDVAFYGGVLIKPVFHEDATLTYGPAEPDFENSFTLWPEATMSGKVPGKPGRPAVPGTKPSDTTDYLVVQVAKDVLLTGQPVARGLIKLFRIKDPKFGEVVEASTTEGKYLLSTTRDFSEFYICGKVVPSIPPLPLLPGDFYRYVMYLRTINFVPRSFEEGPKTKGIVLAILNNKFYVIDTTATTPVWQLLDEQSLAFPWEEINDFGATITTEKLENGGFKMTCSGTNGVGACSGFTFSKRIDSAGRVSFTGVLELRHDGTIPGRPAVTTYTYDGHAKIFTIFNFKIGGIKQIVYTGLQEFSRTGTVGGGAQAIRFDRRTGEQLPEYPFDERLDTFSRTESGTQNVEYLTLAITHHDVVATATETSGNKTMTYSLSYSATIGADPPSLPVVGATNYSRTISAAPLPAVPDTSGYFARQIVGQPTAPRWRQYAWRTSSGASVTDTVSKSGLGGHPFRNILAEGENNPTPLVINVSELTHETSLIAANGSTLRTWPDTFALFDSGRPGWASARTVEEPALPLFIEAPDDPLGGHGSTVESYENRRYSGWPPDTRFLEGASAPLYAWDYNAIYPFSVPDIIGGDSGRLYLFRHEETLHRDQNSINTFPASEMVNIFKSSRWAWPPGAGSDAMGRLDPTGVTITVNEPVRHLSGKRHCDPYNEMNMPTVMAHDPRTDGFVTHRLLFHEHSPGVWKGVLEAYVGNNVSLITLKEVLEEWRTLGEPSNIDTANLFVAPFRLPPAVGVI